MTDDYDWECPECGSTSFDNGEDKDGKIYPICNRCGYLGAPISEVDEDGQLISA